MGNYRLASIGKGSVDSSRRGFESLGKIRRNYVSSLWRKRASAGLLVGKGSGCSGTRQRPFTAAACRQKEGDADKYSWGGKGKFKSMIPGKFILEIVISGTGNYTCVF